MKRILILLLAILSLCGCSNNKSAMSKGAENSFTIIAELCNSSFAPKTEEEYKALYEKYKDTFITDEELKKFLDFDNREVHTNVTLSKYACNYYSKAVSGMTKYVTTMHLDNGSVYTDIEVDFYMKDGKINSTVIRDVGKVN